MEFSRRYNGSVAIHSVSLADSRLVSGPADSVIPQESWFRRDE
jgi:hypothetical protein